MMKQTLATLGLLPVFLLPAVALANCPNENLYPNQVVIVEGDLRFVFGTDAASYEREMSVSMYIGAENIGAATAVIANPSLITPLDAWAVVPGTCTELTESCWDSLLFASPEGVFFFGTPISIEPGECHERVKVWDGMLVNGSEAAPAGTYAVFGGYFNGAFPYEFHAPSGGARVTIVLVESVPVQPATWSAIKQLLTN